jgi:hypothetical protein
MHPSNLFIKTMGLEHISKPPRKPSFVFTVRKLNGYNASMHNEPPPPDVYHWEGGHRDPQNIQLVFFMFVLHTLLAMAQVMYVNKLGLRFNAVEYCVLS